MWELRGGKEGVSEREKGEGEGRTTGHEHEAGFYATTITSEDSVDQ